MRRLLFVGLLLLLAGCAAPHAEETGLEPTVGEVDGVTHNQSIDVTAEDGFTEQELDLLVKRSMARIEVLRELPFERLVDVEVLSREEYRDRRRNRSVEETRRQWENQVWEGLFIVGEDRDVTAVRDQTFGESVQGFYLPGRGRIVIVSDSETPTVDKRTLVHELVHALQDQQFGLRDRPPTQDGQMARNGVVEGEASLLPRLYLDRCDDEWTCVRPETEDSGGEVDPGLFQVVIYPYTQGPMFVETIQARDGWEGVDGLHETLPESTEQVIHPEKYPDEDPIAVNVTDRSSAEWSRIDHDPDGERLGEAAVFSMLAVNEVIEAGSREYRHPASAGWGGDELVPYRGDDGFGYVWELAWDTEEDAAAFHDAYRDLLSSHDAEQVGENRYVISDGPFEDAFRVTRDGHTVRVVNAPTPDQLREIHGG
ncbi:hypothetical protein BRC61_00810 [Halobacteriales archaeon QH_10_65_19]|nr:MAG: hypothetical protein BRC61_00810 [Halobacteriales archaeon QH_10_65_19]